MEPDFKLKLRSFRAVDEPELCKKYIIGHRQVLVDYGVINITSYKHEWIENPSSYGVVAESMDGKELYGGIRVQVANGIFPLPLEDAIGELDSRIYDKIEYYALNGGTGELCGLWNSKKVAGRGLSIILVRAAISIINQLHFKTLVGICAEYTLEMFTRVGFVIDKSLGDHGGFPYPNPTYITRVLGILDASSLATAYPADKEHMLIMRNNLVQSRIESGPKGEFNVEYDLKVRNYVNIVYRKKGSNTTNIDHEK